MDENKTGAAGDVEHITGSAIERRAGWTQGAESSPLATPAADVGGLPAGQIAEIADRHDLKRNLNNTDYRAETAFVRDIERALLAAKAAQPDADKLVRQYIAALMNHDKNEAGRATSAMVDYAMGASAPIASQAKIAADWDLYGTGIKPWSHRIAPNQSNEVIADAMQAELNELRAKIAASPIPPTRGTGGSVDAGGAVPAGFVSMPADLTPEMRRAAIDAANRHDIAIHGDDLAHLYSAFRAAAPVPPAAPAEQQSAQAPMLHLSVALNDADTKALSQYTQDLAAWVRSAPTAQQSAQAERAAFQQRVQPWMLECFGPAIAADTQERNHRFFEEATELVQACGMTQDEAHMLVDYTYGRPIGEKSQEVGGVMVTLAALCLAQDLDMHEAAETELARIWTKVDVIRAKQASKPKGSPLPVAQEVEQPHNPSQYGSPELQALIVERAVEQTHMAGAARQGGDTSEAAWAEYISKRTDYPNPRDRSFFDAGFAWSDRRVAVARKVEFTEADIFAAARVLADRSAEACGVDKDDNWKIYSEDFIADARTALAAIRSLSTAADGPAPTNNEQGESK